MNQNKLDIFLTLTPFNLADLIRFRISLEHLIVIGQWCLSVNCVSDHFLHRSARLMYLVSQHTLSVTE